jgi:threonine dehydratase
LKLVDRTHVVEAAKRISGLVERTALIETRISGHSLWLKCECLQTGGAFKLRGATNRLAQLSKGQGSRGVVAFSSGNHAQGVALAAKRLGIAAVIVMPSDAPAVKVEATRSHGAQIVFYDRRTESREAIAQGLADERGAVVVPSFDDSAIVAGQGTVGLEIVEQLGASPPQIVIPCGGGGLSSGIALACPDSRIVIVEPDGWDDMKRSLEQGQIVPVEPDAPPTLCDALQTPRVSPITFDILRDRQAEAVSVNDEEVKQAIRFAWEEHKLVVEPGGAAALAALLSGIVAPEEGGVAVISGGNIDPELHARIVSEG